MTYNNLQSCFLVTQCKLIKVLPPCDYYYGHMGKTRSTLIEVFKILNGNENIYRNIFLSLKKDSRTRRLEETIVKDRC